MLSRINLKRCILLQVACLLFVASSYAQSSNVIISEFMAVNNSTLVDEEGDYPDWIEINNKGTEAINLDGWYLTDDASDLTKWKFPDVSLDQGDFLVVFASDKVVAQISSTLHANFKLSGSGEYLALVETDGLTIASSFGESYPAQQADISYGLYNDQYVYMSNPTPGAANTIGGDVLAPEFSQQRGFYATAFSVTLSSANSNCDIYYTTTGDKPTLENGIKYTDPVAIDKTTVLSAVSIDKNTMAASSVSTQTYLFVDAIMEQPNNPEGYPAVWEAGHTADYEMDPEISTDANKTEIEESLKALPTISLVTNIDHLFYDSDTAEIGGLYMNTTKHTEEWERPVSMEYFDGESNKSFQVNCGLRIHGGNSRKPGNSPKHGFRVSFRSKYGPSKLNYNMYEEGSATNEFNSLVLRGGYNYTWIKNNPTQCKGADFIRDPFAKKTQLDMDRTAAHTKYVHLYLNGMYWGVYDMSEKITNDFIESYLGGSEDDYDIVKDHNGVVDGDRVAWDALLAATDAGFETNEKYFKVQGKNADGSVNSSYQNLLDVRNFIDYMIINYYMANGDWDRNNWLAGRNRVSNKHGFKFFCWDAETSMNGVEDSNVDLNNPGNPTGIYNALKSNKEFKIYFADRINKHFFNGGALTPAEAEERYMAVAETLNKSLLAESARWGDYRRDVEGGSDYELYTVENQWQTRVDFMQDTYFPQRTDIVLAQFKDEGLYPEIEAPVFSHFSGEYANSFSLSISSDGSDAIYYTFDNTDPREIGGAVSTESALEYVNAIDISSEIIIKARAKKGNEWSALTRARFKFYENPGAPVLVYPAQATMVDSDKDIDFKWEKAQEDNLIYRLHITDGLVTKTYVTSTDTSVLMPANTFVQNKTYRWKVTASDGVDELSSGENVFTTNNIAPGEFNIVSHTTGSTIDATTDIVFEWTKSLDVDDLTYELQISDGESTLKYTTQDTNYVLLANSLSVGKTYSLQVAASDGQAQTTTVSIEINTLTDIESEGSLAYVKVYPNPTANNVNVEIQNGNSLPLVLELCDIAGRVLSSEYLSNNEQTQTLQMDLSTCRKGVYFVVLRSGSNNVNFFKTEKIIKE